MSGPGRSRVEAAKRGARRTVALLSAAIGSFSEHKGSQFAAAISYYALLSLFPAAIAATAVFGLFLGDEEARRSIVDSLNDALPVSEGEGTSDVEELVSGVTRNAGTLGVIGVVGLLISGSALMSSVRNALAVVNETSEQRPPLAGKAFDVLLLIALGSLITLSLAATLAAGLGADLGEALPGGVVDVLIKLFEYAIPSLLAAVAFFVLYRLVPLPRPSWRDVWPGVVIAVVGYELVKRGFSFYLENFADYSAVYGSLGAVIAYLAFVYLTTIFFLIGAEAAAAWPRVRAAPLDAGDEEDDRSAAHKVAGAIRGLFVRDSRKPHPASPEAAEKRARSGRGGG